jgi:low temperature requirement protein LtrA
MAIRVLMRSRDTNEEHRAATPLELFFDLVFVVAIAQAASSLHHGLAEDHVGESVLGFVLVFFAIWWAWMNFTWFASAYDPDDVPYRLSVFVIMVGVLILAAGVPRAFDGEDFGVITLGYVVMRLAMVTLWLRVATSIPEHRRCALRYALGIFIVQILWVARLAIVEDLRLTSFLVLVVAELAVPAWAERAGRTSWHPEHITERYGLFTIIVLGESLLAATIGVQAALDADSTFADLALVIVGGLVTVFAMWWLYFDLPREQIVHEAREGLEEHLSRPFIWGYGHYLVFASVAATGAGLAVAVDQATHHSELSDIAAALCVTLPVSVYLLAVWGLHAPYKRSSFVRNWAIPIGVVLVLLSSLTPDPVLLTGAVVAAVVALGVVFPPGTRFQPSPRVTP